MSTIIHTLATVNPDGKVEISAPELVQASAWR